MRSWTVRSIVCVSLVAGLALPVRAEKKDQAPPPYQPPSLRFEQPVPLLEAVRLTLEHDPNIKLQESTARLRRGIFQEQAGQFDFHLTGSFEYDYTRQELTQTTKDQQIENRHNIENAIPVAEGLVARSHQAIQDLITARDRGTSDKVTDPAVAAQLAMLDGLIANARDAQEQQAFRDLRTRVINRAIDAFNEQLPQIEAAPGQLRQQRAQLGDAPIDEWFKSSTANLTVGRQMHFGPSLNVFSDGGYDSQNYVGKSNFDSAFGGKGILPLYNQRVGMSLTLPLFRGLGGDNAAASERAARIDWEASTLTAQHQAGVSALATIQAYWAARAAAEQLAVSERSVDLQNSLVNLTQQLVKAGEQPKTEEARVLASQADALARVEGARRSLAEAKVNLAKAMGVSVKDVDTAPAPSDPFVAPPAEGVTATDEAVAALTAMAEQRRLDLQASARSQESGRVAARGARLDMRPQVDLGATGYFKALGENSYSEATSRFVGPSGSGSLNIDIPITNDLYRGRWEQREADYQQRQISAADVRRNIELNVARLTRSLQLAAARVTTARAAVDNYDRTIVAEQEKLKAGDSTLVDTILTEQQTTAARFALVDAQQQYANLLAQLRFEIGDLVTGPEGDNRVTEQSLFSVPAPLVGGTK